MKRFLLKLLVTLIVFYGLGGVAYGLLRYPAAERPEVGQILSDYTRDLSAVFRRKEPEAPPAPKPAVPPKGESATHTSLDELTGDLTLTMPLAQIIVPGSLDRLPRESAERWGALKPIIETVLPEAESDISRLRALKKSDKPAFDTERAATRAKLATARTTLERFTKEDPPFETAVTVLGVLEAIDAKIAGL